MSEQSAEKFIEALGKLENNEDVETIVALFADDADIGNVTLTNTLNGTDGVREFWTNYRKTFGEVNSKFHNKICSENVSALEWTTTGTSANGSEINYDGVSILEFNDGGKIERFFAYFNPAKIGHQIEEAKANAG
ncbi:MAG: nuclear transport factor 2 family protein [Pyrinomonadaceae bacterium]